MTDSQARVAAIFAADTARAHARADASMRITSHLWIQWSQIAIEHFHTAAREREVAMAIDRAVPDKSHLFAEALARETRAAMVAVSASAHALDALYGAVKPVVPIPPTMLAAWEANRTARHRVILETFTRGFAVGKYAKAWQSEIDWLDDVRDAAIHFEEETKEPVRHPAGTNTAPENVIFSIESAQRAVTLLLTVLSTCVHNPKAGNKALVAYAGRMSDAVGRLVALMATPGS